MSWHPASRANSRQSTDGRLDVSIMAGNMWRQAGRDLQDVAVTTPGVLLIWRQDGGALVVIEW